MESKADAERYHRYNEPDPEMDDGGYRTPHKPSYATMAPDNELDEVTFRHRDTDFDTLKAPLYNLGDDVTVRAGGAGPTGDISPDWPAAAGRRPSDSPDSHMEYLFQKMMMQLSEFGDVVAKLTSEKPSEGHGQTPQPSEGCRRESEGRRRESEGTQRPSGGHEMTPQPSEGCRRESEGRRRVLEGRRRGLLSYVKYPTQILDQRYPL